MQLKRVKKKWKVKKIKLRIYIKKTSFKNNKNYYQVSIKIKNFEAIKKNLIKQKDW